MFALADLDNFYASCQSLFQTELRGRPLVVKSNNDGCVIARSAEAKALGIRMGQPVHELGEYISKHHLQLKSANFTLYGDLSRRVVQILRDAVPRLETYSIDEQFLDLSGIANPAAFARALRLRVKQWTGLSCSIGVSPTRTLAKLSSKLAKTAGAGVVDLADVDMRTAALNKFPVMDVWGVGNRTALKLQAMDITTAGQLRDAAPDLILARFGVTLARTQRELQGHACQDIEESEPDRKQIVVSRSFGSRIEDPAAVAQALSTFAIRAAEKMRSRGLSTGAVWVFANTDTFRPELRQHHPSRAITLPYATQDTRLVLAAVRDLLTNLLRRGCAYKRAGVALMDLAKPEDLQADLFGPAVQGNEALMATLDRINGRFGRGTAGFAASGWKRAPAWGMKQRDLSPCFTTRWADLPTADCGAN